MQRTLVGSLEVGGASLKWCSQRVNLQGEGTWYKRERAGKHRHTHTHTHDRKLSCTLHVYIYLVYFSKCHRLLSADGNAVRVLSRPRTVFERQTLFLISKPGHFFFFMQLNPSTSGLNQLGFTSSQHLSISLFTNRTINQQEAI